MYKDATFAVGSEDMELTIHMAYSSDFIKISSCLGMLSILSTRNLKMFRPWFLLLGVAEFNRPQIEYQSLKNHFL